MKRITDKTRKREKITIKGIVQGVGFRPAVYRQALNHKLSGFVFNDSNGVIIEVEGNSGEVDSLISKIKNNPPKNAKITGFNVKPAKLKNEKTFRILTSVALGEVSAEIAPDISLCDDCLKELFDKNNRRYLYPFINCTNCGPRYTIIKSVPYDRKYTTMKSFKMCRDCQREYDGPENRRFHAQPNACPVCGPKVQFVKNGSVGARFIEPATMTGTPAIEKTVKLLKAGKIIAIKGLGGFHLACDASNDEAVRRLRTRKYREEKPFAVMAKNLPAIEKYFKLTDKEKELLVSSGRPVVLVKNIPKNKLKISKYIVPSNTYLGLMLPYTPLHQLIFNLDKSSPQFMVMTSGNVSDEPICYSNEDALKRLGSIADYFLVNDRDIQTRCDDSVTRDFHGSEMIVRRSRGYVPSGIKSPFYFKNHVLACGAHLKNTFCAAKDNNIYVSHHIGDLENLETLNAFEKGIESFKKMFGVTPQIVAHDLHLGYLSTKYAVKYKKLHPGIKLAGVQHHHAHIASCMVDNLSENRIRLKKDEEVIGVAFDGTGYGQDGHVWGAEVLLANFKEYRRYAHLAYIPMPGGDKAIKEPWRMACSYLYNIFGDKFLELNIPFTKQVDRKKWEILRQTGSPAPLASSMGRLFDAAASLAGIKDIINYEGQAAIELEQAIPEQDKNEKGAYPYDIICSGGIEIIEPGRIFKGIIRDLQNKVSVSIISVRFHNTISNIVNSLCLKARKDTGLNKVALSGGVFQNMFLLNRIYGQLIKNKFEVLVHSLVPTNDGGICLGQAVIAAYSADSNQQTADSKVKVSFNR